MRYWVGCSIVTVNTNLLCDIEIGEKTAKTPQMNWDKIGGRLDLGADEGRWFNFKPDGNYKGIVLFPHKEGEERSKAYSDAEIMVTLLGVPERFAEKLGCGEYFSGDGTLHKTGERIIWRMWYPCA
jgi:hypothetical protein